MARRWGGAPQRDTRSIVLARLMVLLIAASLTAMAGCAPPPLEGIDGDLTDGWTAFDEPSNFVPAAGTCHRTEAVSGSARYYLPVDCARLHRFETVHVGTFTGAHAQRMTAPVADGPAREAARVECETQSAEFLGDIWQDGLLQLTVVVPPQLAWSSGARWFRCDLAEVSSVLRGKVQPRTGGLRGALTDGGPLRLGCHEVRWDDYDHIEALEPVECGQLHNGEFVGTFDRGTLPPMDHNSSQTEDEMLHEHCLGMIADHADLPVDEDLPYRVGAAWFRTEDSSAWVGDLRVRCFLYLWAFSPPLDRSAKGGGPDLLPVW